MFKIMTVKKEFFKITFQDMEIAEDFFDNEKHFSEFLLAVSYYYRRKNYQIKNKIVQKYFKTYQKTMDNIIEAKRTGKIGGLTRVDNQSVNKQPLEGVVKGSVKDPVQPNYKVLTIKDKYNNTLLSEIKNFKSFYSSFEFNKQYFHIAYKFWEMWEKENPENKTIKSAKLVNWYETIRLIIEVDKQKIERLIAIYKYFQKCQSKDPGFRQFWFKTVKSVGGLRDTNDKQEYRLDKIADEVNDKIEKDEMFGRLVEKSINDFKKY